jgi:hypothetical protein
MLEGKGSQSIVNIKTQNRIKLFRFIVVVGKYNAIAVYTHALFCFVSWAKVKSLHSNTHIVVFLFLKLTFVSHHSLMSIELFYFMRWDYNMGFTMNFHYKLPKLFINTYK